SSLLFSSLQFKNDQLNVVFSRRQKQILTNGSLCEQTQVDIHNLVQSELKKNRRQNDLLDPLDL
ncbi:hypothetical protein M8C21_007436, partial [Ambrosia artemisiifolia]